jgi:hypothetical protein
MFKLQLGCVLLLFSAGCALTRPPLVEIQPWPDESEQTRMEQLLKRELTASFPRDVRMAHRVIMTAAGRQFVFNGYLSVRTDGTMRLIVMSDIGTVADFETRPDGSVVVARCNPKFSKRWVKRYIARDLLLLFGAPDHDALVAGELADGSPVLEMTLPAERQVRRYVFDAGSSEWSTLEVTRKGKRYYRAVCSRRRTFPDWDRALPAAFTVKAPKYQLEVAILSVQHGAE